MDPTAIMGLLESSMASTSLRFERLKAMGKLKKAALALGPEQVRNRLLPFLAAKIPKEEDEVLNEIAKQLGEMGEATGGPPHGHMLLAPLEQICESEETVVRAAAAASYSKVVLMMDWEVGGQQCMEIVRRLASDWFTKKVAACGMLAALYERCDPGLRPEVLQLFFGLMAKDETPMVKRAAWEALPGIAAAVANVNELAVLADLVAFMERESSEEVQESVVVKLAEALVGVIIAWCSIEDQVDACFEAVQGQIAISATSTSWRVRHVMAGAYGKLARALMATSPIAAVERTPFFTGRNSPFVQLMRDFETEVRLAAVKALPEVAEVCGPPTLAESVIPCFDDLTQDQMTSVRTETAKTLLAMVPQRGVQLELLADRLVQLVHDPEKSVQLTVLAALEEALASEHLDTTGWPEVGPFAGVLESVYELASNDDWRLRRAVVSLSASLARTMGAEYFKTNMMPFLLKALEDYITDVRLGAVATLPALIRTLGQDWLREDVMPAVLGMWEGIREPNAMSPAPKRSSYLLKITVINALGAIGMQQLQEDIAESALTLLHTAVSDDRTPNVRFNAVNALAALAPFVRHHQQSLIRSALTTMVASDADADCKYYAEQALASLPS